MKHFIFSALTGLCILFSSPIAAQDTPLTEVLAQPAEGINLSDFKWKNRILVVFADSPLDPSFRQQMELINDRPNALIERDVLVFTDVDPNASTLIRTTLRPRGFGIVLLDKDGTVMLRKPDPWHLRELTRAIDKTPLRRDELRR